jgi:iron complex transport system substrate-binding protein
MGEANVRVPCSLFRAAAAVVAALVCSGTCARAQEPAQPKAGQGTAAAGTAPATPATREVTDEAGRTVRVPVDVRRIVSLAPNLTETIYALGAQERLVAVTDYCDYPPAAQSKPRVGGAVNPSLEQVVAMKPDLVLAQASGMNRPETVEALERLGVTVYAAQSRTVEGMIESTRHIASVIGAADAGEKAAADMRSRLGELKQRLAGRERRRVLFIVWHEPLITVGRHTFIADALRLAGAESAVDLEQDWPRLNLEEVVRAQPEYLIFASSHSEAITRTFEDLRDRPGWRVVEAVKQRRMAVISDAVNRPAPRLVEAIEQLARQLHPDAFAGDEKKQKPEKTPPPLASGPALGPGFFRWPSPWPHFPSACAAHKAAQ